MTDRSGGDQSELDEFEAESRWLAFKESAVKRMSRHAAEADADEQRPVEPFASPSAFGSWSVEAARALVDLQFRRTATRTLLPLAYLLGLAGAVAIPIATTVLLLRSSMWVGVVFAVVFAIPLGLTIAATVRLLLEFLVNASRLAGKVEHIAELADDLFQALSDVAEPVNQLSEDMRAVQFWRFRKRNSRK
ncbi:MULTISPECIES: DUF4282 domain-containing protein [Nocardia]|uniref:DUF4282 domain-containing protein n=1 Tax=Nocardia otitidiscaviarum TaxID=1823 RepID=A0A516NU62_9NOCA|nr:MULTISPECIES: DUF4282 domain-containing protein [Nocardia]MCP9621814.1 DUF4282 domain-containing protein [Nocardia otitidiscaviarum]QDP82443.1 DUF4282 domain-containing protein [Nocardia otitidiscaviarum]